MPKRTHRKERSCTAAQYTQPKQPGIANQLEALLTPAIFAQLAYYRQLGLRFAHTELAADGGSGIDSSVATGSGCTRINSLGIAREDLLCCRATKISQQALSERFLVFPAELFERVFKDLPLSILSKFGWLTVSPVLKAGNPP